MFLRRGFCYARRRHTQRVWNANASSHGAAPANGITASEALQIAYRPMPLAQTVEYEEDFGANLIIHREFISAKNRDIADFQLTALAYSDVEIERGRQHLANIMNRERAGAVVGAGGLDEDRVSINISKATEGPLSGHQTAKYLFDSTRMEYCERFMDFFRKMKEPLAVATTHGSEVEKSVQSRSENIDLRSVDQLFSLMEACAVLYGCATRDAQETYLQMFLGLSTAQLEAAEAKATEARDAFKKNIVNEENSDSSKDGSVALCKDTPLRESSLPSIFDLSPEKYSESTEQASSVTPTVIEKATVGSYDLREFASLPHLQDQMRWRKLIEKLVCEQYETLTPEDYGDACVLNHQLHTVKFLDLKLGDTIEELMAQQQQSDRFNPSSAHRDSSALHTPHNPEQRDA